MKRLFSIICLAAACLVAGCTKEKTTVDPCENLLSERSPDKVILHFVDKVTGKSLFAGAGLTGESITVSDLASGEVYKNWVVLPNKVIGTGKGTLEVALFPQKAGEFGYRIALGNQKEAVLEFKVSIHKSDSPCRADFFGTNDYKISGGEFSYFENQGTVYKNTLIVKI